MLCMLAFFTKHCIMSNAPLQRGICDTNNQAYKNYHPVHFVSSQNKHMLMGTYFNLEFKQGVWCIIYVITNFQ